MKHAEFCVALRQTAAADRRFPLNSFFEEKRVLYSDKMTILMQFYFYFILNVTPHPTPRLPSDEVVICLPPFLTSALRLASDPVTASFCRSVAARHCLSALGGTEKKKNVVIFAVTVAAAVKLPAESELVRLLDKGNLSPVIKFVQELKTLIGNFSSPIRTRGTLARFRFCFVDCGLQ